MARIQENRSLASRIASLGDGLSAERLIHGDVRWENCVAVAARPGLRRTRVLLIDWELAGRGVPAFDVGSVLAEYLRVWVGSVPIASPSPPGQAGYPLARMQPAVGAFWSAYREAGARVPLREVIELTALRLLQAAVERIPGPRGAVEACDDAGPARGEPALAAGGRGAAAAGASGMTSGHEQVSAALRAVAFSGATRYVWLGRAREAVASPLDSRERRARLVGTLTAQLYASFYCAGSPLPGFRGADGPLAADPSLARALSEANTGQGRGSGAGPSSAATATVWCSTDRGFGSARLSPGAAVTSRARETR